MISDCVQRHFSWLKYVNLLNSDHLIMASKEIQIIKKALLYLNLQINHLRVSLKSEHYDLKGKKLILSNSLSTLLPETGLNEKGALLDSGSRMI